MLIAAPSLRDTAQSLLANRINLRNYRVEELLECCCPVMSISKLYRDRSRLRIRGE